MSQSRGRFLSIEADWVAVDWGTSNLRAWGIGPGGEIRFSRTSDQGMGRLSPDAYPEVLTRLIDDEFAAAGPQVDVLICGMAGARQGWREAAYLEAPVELGGLAAGAVVPSMPVSRFAPRILPGVCQRFGGAEDVMRGEETQLLGLASLMPGFSGLVVMPGTHSKWAVLAGRRIERFSTSMTGELFEILQKHSVLRHSVGDEDEGRNEGFETGLSEGLAAPQRLIANLFKIRAASLLSNRSRGWSAGYLSGLLIGAEIGGQRDWIGGAEIPLVGGPTLCALYARGFAMIGAKARIVDATDATLAGLKAARQGQWSST